MTNTVTEPRLSTTGSGFEVDHLWCCDPDWAWCGADLTNESWCPEDCVHDECALCLLAEPGLPDCIHQGEADAQRRDQAVP